MIPLLTNQVVRVRKSKRRTMIEPSKKLMSIVRRDNPSPIDFLDHCDWKYSSLRDSTL